jgi:prophage antirepressor-like protein
MDIVKAFNENSLNIDINIKGTTEEPLFRATDIGLVLQMTNIHQTLKNFKNTEKVLTEVYTLGGMQNVTFLTEKGLYKILFKSQMKIAEKFTDWVCDVIKKIRINGTYELRKTLEEKDKRIKEITETIEDKNKLLEAFLNTGNIDINEYLNQPVVYVLKILDKKSKCKYKYGSSDDIETRLTTHANRIGNIELLRLYKTKKSSISRKIESAATRYAKINKINSNYKNEKKEIVKTDEAGINILMNKIEEWADKYIEEDKSDKIKSDKLAIELINKQIEFTNILVNSGADGNTIGNLLTKQLDQDVTQKNMKNVRLIKVKEMTKTDPIPDGVKCGRCGHTKTENEFGINKNTNQTYSTCYECREKTSLQNMEKNKKDNELIEKKYNEKISKIKETRNKLLTSKDSVKCSNCKENRTSPEMGIDKRKNQLYKMCFFCREKRKKTLQKNSKKDIPVNSSEVVNDTSLIATKNTTECNKCHENFKTEFNPLKNSNFRMCQICRKKDQGCRENAKKPTLECRICHKEMEAELNQKKNIYYKSHKKCRDKNKKYDKQRTEKFGDKINQQKKEYYQKQKEEIRKKQKEYYDKNSKTIIEHKKKKNGSGNFLRDRLLSCDIRR